jgi:hypothetical protein
MLRVSAMGAPARVLSDRTISLLAAIRRSVAPLSRADGLMLLYGHPAARSLGLYAAADRALAGEPVVYLDGANAFDPFVLSRVARGHGVRPQKLLGAVHVARAFTCHQMERLVSECLAFALDRYQSRVAILSGPLETFYDEAVPAEEAARLLQRMIASLRKLSVGGSRVLCLCPNTAPQHQSRYGLLMQLQAAATRLIHVEEADGMVRLDEETTGSTNQWEIPQAVLTGC